MKLNVHFTLTAWLSGELPQHSVPSVSGPVDSECGVLSCGFRGAGSGCRVTAAAASQATPWRLLYSVFFAPECSRTKRKAEP